MVTAWYTSFARKNIGKGGEIYAHMHAHTHTHTNINTEATSYTQKVGPLVF